jgi:hypothetical protein
MSIYSWKPGSRCTVPAQEAGKELERISGEHNGVLKPAVIVQESRPEDATLHPCFEWDDPKAANLWREDQARSIVRSIRVIPDDSPQPDEPLLVYVHVATQDDGPCYTTTARAMSDDELREQVIAQALAQLEGWRKRFEHLQELRDVFVAIDRATRRRARPSSGSRR